MLLTYNEHACIMRDYCMIFEEKQSIRNYGPGESESENIRQ